MDLETFIVSTYCLIDDLMAEVLGDRRLRSRGPNPLLDDREVITIEVVGEFLGLDTDKGIFTFFCRHYAQWFPKKLANVDRTTFTRQAANLWKVKKLMWKALLQKIEHDEAICLVDSFAVPVCSFAKAPRHKSFAGIAARGYDAMSRAVFYGFEGYLRVAWPGVVVEATLAPANEHDRWVGEYDLLGGVMEGTFVVGDTNYWSPLLKEDLAGYGSGVDRPEEELQEARWPSVAQMVDQHQATHRDGDKPVGGTLRGQGGKG